MSALDAASLPLGLRESHEKSSIDAPAQTRSTAEQKRQIAAGRKYGSHSRTRRVGRVRVFYGRLRFGAELSAFPQGGADDATARIIQDAMQRALGQPIVIENLGGARGPNRSGT
jgi:hypothetical protein